MNKSRLIWVHLAYWCYVFVLSEIMNKLAYQKKFIELNWFTDVLALTNYLLFGLTFYINYLFVLPRFFNKKKYFLTFTSWLFLVIAFIAARYWVQEIFLPANFAVCNYCSNNIRIYAVNNFFQGTSTLIFASTIIWFIDNWLKVTKQQFLLQQEKLTAERAFLQSQVSPHFLFNTLNNIYSMVFHKSASSLIAIQKLAEIMRYSVRNYHEEGVELETELLYLRNYIELQKLRVKKPVIYYTETGDFTNIKIYPMLLVSFVENAFKHGIINDRRCPVEIHFSVSSGSINFLVKNKINRLAGIEGSGLGQDNMRKRLAMFYPDRYKLLISSEADIYTTQLTIKV